ncbi:MAG: polysaccharide biosynthesis protein [Flavobacteriales bacterium]|nr:polysaccharide biosynthesis protein [Flavobacteriales bacterium]MBK7555970.1 polysaccharide biosynthesis protein [Flavobacteriales bacterium]
MSRTLPRWTILVIDLCMCVVALLAAYQLRFNFEVPPWEYALLWPVLPVFVLVRLVSLWVARIHMSQVKHTSTEDAKRIFLTVMVGSAVFGLLSAVRFFALDGVYFLPRTVIIIDFMATTMLLITSRIAMKLLYLRAKGSGKDEVRVVLYGAGESGLITKRTLERDGSRKYKVEAFVDDNAKKAGQRLEGVPIASTATLPDLLANGEIDQVIITVQQPDAENRRRVVEMCMAAKTHVLSVPPVSSWINGQLSPGQIREVRIEDLLGRAPIALDDAKVRARFAGKRVLVTGAAGSIGSEIARQLIALGAGRTVLLDNAESALYDLEMELKGKGHSAYAPVIGDVRDREAMERLLTEARPDVIFHAAAYKHVPLMEAQPEQAIRTNLLGTRNMAELAVQFNVSTFVLISTDKAVNPTSVMGASKRVAEMMVQGIGSASSLNASGRTNFITTRFGNVLGSNGSVIPLFRRQIAEGGPVTVTDPEVTRFFMTIPEACRLVLEAATMGKGGEIYVFDMGQPVRILDLAEKMIRLSGKEPGRDIEVVFTGLRPGEKRFEELLATQENTLPTHHPRILIGKTREVDPAAVQPVVSELIGAANDGDGDQCVRLMKRIVPEYKSEHSAHAQFDAPSPSEIQGA